MSIFNAPVTKIHMLQHDWTRIEIIIGNTDTIANALYPTLKQRKTSNELRPRDKAFQWARYHFTASMGSALVKTEEIPGKDIIAVYLLTASASVLIQAMDAVLSNKTLSDKVYRPVVAMDATALCAFIDPPAAKDDAEETDAPAFSSAMAVDGDLIKELNRQLTSSTEVSALRMLV